MELRVLEYFLAVAETGNMTQAATRLHLTQPTLSRQLMSLERELGCSLFVRGTRHLSLTPEGVLLRRRAQELIELSQIAREEIAQSGADLSGTVAIGCGDFSVVEEVGSLMRRFCEQHPNVAFRMLSASTDDILEYMERGLLDFGIVPGSSERKGYRGLGFAQNERWVALIPPGDELLARDVVAPADLEGRSLILPRNAGQTAITHWFTCPLERLRVVCENNLTANTAMLVASGLGCALVMEGSTRHWGSEVGVRPLNPPLVSPIALLWKAGVPLGPTAARFLELAREELGQGGRPVGT